MCILDFFSERININMSNTNREIYAPLEKVTSVDTTDNSINIYLNIPAIGEKAVNASATSDQALLLRLKGLNKCLIAYTLSKPTSIALCRNIAKVISENATATVIIKPIEQKTYLLHDTEMKSFRHNIYITKQISDRQVILAETVKHDP
jgi:hypothetical protein